jgi:hypothetical protein
VKDLFTTLSIDICVMLYVLFGDIEIILKIVLLAATILYTCVKIFNELKNKKP